MADGKNTFMLYVDNNDMIQKLPDEKAGQLFKHIYKYVSKPNNEPLADPEDLVVALAFEVIKKSLKADLKKYEEKCAKNKENSRKYWDKKKEEMNTEANQNKPNDNRTVSNGIQTTSDTDTDTDTDTDISNNKGFNKLNLPQNDAEPKDKKSFNLELFDLFWAAYPLKKEKQNCLKWFKSHKPSKEQVQKMITAIEIQKKSSQWREGYIKYPYTWLNSGSWDDEPEQHVLNQIKPDNRGFEEL